jgi:hypothetical protein
MVIVAALLHALWNIVAKKTGVDRHSVLMGGPMLSLTWAHAGLWLGWNDVPRWDWPAASRCRRGEPGARG